MYCNHFGLRCRPFEDRADTQFFYSTADREEALAAMEYEIHFGKGTTLVLGEAGTGKTLLIRTLLQRLDASDHVVVLTWPSSGQMDLVREAAKGFGISLPSSHHEARCLARLRRHLMRTRKANHHSILIIDQAENLTTENMAQVATLLDLQDDGGRLLSIALVGQPHFRTLLEHPQFERIAQQFYGERLLARLSLTATEGYLQHRLRVAGVGDGSIFDQGAVALIHKASRGIPRLVNHMCDAAMLAAYGARETRITRQIATEVTGRGTSHERSVDVSELGINTTEQVAAGLPRDYSPNVVPTHSFPGLRGPNRPSSPIEPDGVDDWPTVSPKTGTGYARAEASANPSFAASAVEDEIDDCRLHGALDQTTAFGSVGLMFASGQALLTRLERALARADRMYATSDATLAQFTAVERHLATLAGNAEGLIGELTRTTQHANESLESAHRRLEMTFEQAEARVQVIDTQLSRVSDVSSDVEENTRRVERACEHGDQVESRLASFAEQLADKGEEVQKRMTLLMSGLDASETAQSELRALVDEASSLSAGATSTIDLLRGTIGEAKTEAERFQKEFTDAVLRDWRQTLQEQFDAHLRTLQETADAALSTHRAKLQRTIEEYASEVQALEQAVTAGRRTAGETLADCERSGVEICDKARHELDQLQRQVQTLDGRQKGVRSSFTALSNDIEAASAKTNDLTGMVQAAMSPMEELAHRAAATRADLSPLVEQAERLVRDVPGACGHVEALQRSVAATLVDIGGACERASAARDQTARCEQIVSRLADGVVNGERTANQLEEATSSGRQLLQSVQESTTHADDRMERLECQSSSAGNMLDDLTRENAEARATIELAHEAARAAENAARVAREQNEQLKTRQTAGESIAGQLNGLIASAEHLHEAAQDAVAQADGRTERLESENASAGEILDHLARESAEAQAAIEQVRESATVAEHATEAVREQNAQLTALNTASEQTVEQLSELVTSAAQLHEAFQGVIAHADEKAGQLDSHNAAAAQVLRRLSEANIEGHALVDRANDSTQKAENAARETGERIDRLLQDVSALAARSETYAKEMETHNTRVAELSEKLGAMTEPAEAIAAELAQRTGLAKQESTILAERCEHADRTAHRLRSITRVLRAAREIRRTVTTTTESARAANALLSSVTSDATDRCESLHALNAAALELIEVHERVKIDAQAETERLAGQLTVMRESMESGETMVNDFASQTQTLGQRLQDLEEKCIHIERTLNDVTARPSEILETAQAQAAELERVCAVVRKIFAGLSQSSLEARKHSAECRQIGQETTRQLAQLKAETDLAAETLHEWTEEAIRIQSRLERTLQRSPSLGDTHPVGTLLQMSRVARTGAQIANSSAGGGPEAMNAPGTSGPSASREATATPVTRTEEIARLIGEAKEATAGAKS